MTNEAAERVKDWIMFQHPNEAGKDMRQKIDAALAAERKATVERIRAALAELTSGISAKRVLEIDAILDAEAER